MVLGAIPSLMAGVLAWSASEYVVHRWLMHAPRGTSTITDQHLDHHRDPLDTVALRWDSHNVGYKGGALLVGSAVVSPAFGVGFAASYAGYTHLHHQIHHASAPTRWPTRTLAPLWSRHHRHHFGSPRQHFGVTSPLWDLVSRTERFETETGRTEHLANC